MWGSPLHSRRLIVLCVLLGMVIFGWFKWRSSLSRRQQSEHPALTIDKQPVSFTNRTFDPNSPPADMPTLTYGEEAVCDSNFISNTSVGGESELTDSMHATVTVTKIKMILQLRINIWVPSDVTQHVVEHEDGHRQISEYYYQTADKLAARIAATYMGKKIDISGSDLDGQFNRVLRQTATDITNEYNKDLSPGPTQQYFDLITDHGRNESVVKESVAAALANQSPTTSEK